MLCRCSSHAPSAWVAQVPVQNALKNLEEFATMMRVLGSYPIGE